MKDFCEYCGSLLDSNGDHTSDWKTRIMCNGKWKRAKLYNVWGAMKGRCSNPNEYNWRWYGAKGIKVCAEWQKFAGFREWAVNNGYGPNLVIDRIDSGKDYCPENCRWITSTENQPQLKLSEKDVFDILRSKEKGARLAEKYGVHNSVIYNIRTGKRWSELTGVGKN